MSTVANKMVTATSGISMRSSTNVNLSAAWVPSEELSGSSEVEAATARAGLPPALLLSMTFLFASD